MKMTSRIFAAVSVCAAVLAFAGMARAQQPEPLYPYLMQPQYLAPQARTRIYPAVRASDEKPRKAVKRKHSKIDPALIEELRRRGDKTGSINKRIVVREKARVIENERIVDDPPITVQRHITIDENRPHNGGRTIRAEAEVTIIGPDRMSIRLFRKRSGADANAKAN